MDLISIRRKYKSKIIRFTITLIVILLLIVAFFCYRIYDEILKEKSYQDSIFYAELAKIKMKQEELYKEQQRLEKLPSLTDEGRTNIEQIYHSDTKRVFLTFDDGPSETVTLPILELLKQENIKATFFVLGSRVDLYPEIVKKEYLEGHYIANHGYSHVYSQIYTSTQSVLDEYNKTNNSIRNAIGVPEYNSHLFRFPGGSAGGYYKNLKIEAKNLLNQNDIVSIDWNALTGDSEKQNPTAEELMQKLCATVGDKNSIVLLMHDSSNKQITYQVLPDVINYFKERGYEFENFYQIIK